MRAWWLMTVAAPCAAVFRRILRLLSAVCRCCRSDVQFIGVNAFLFVSLILCCLLIGGLIKRYKITFLPESAGSMIFGFICGAFLNFTSAHEKAILEFSPDLIFFVILPPIILDAGKWDWQQHRRNCA